MPSTVEQWLQNRRLAAIEEGGEGGVHPNLAAHDALGLATDAALAAHAGDGGLHSGSHPNLAVHDALGLVTEADLSAHAATSHGGTHPDLADHNTLGLATQAELDAVAAAKANASHAHADIDLPASIARDTEVTAAVSAHAATPHAGDHPDADHATLATDAELAAHAADGGLHGGGGAHPDLASHDALGLVPDTLIAASGMGTVIHGATAGTTRPSGYAAIHWIGTVTPSNAVDGDIWTDTDEAAGGGSHPDLATHDSLGLATDADLAAHAATPHAGDHPDGDHATLATSASVTAALAGKANTSHAHDGGNA